MSGYLISHGLSGTKRSKQAIRTGLLFQPQVKRDLPAQPAVGSDGLELSLWLPAEMFLRMLLLLHFLQVTFLAASADRTIVSKSVVQSRHSNS